MPPYQPPKRTSYGGVPYPPVWIISFPSCCGRHPVYVLARAVWRYGILPPLFCFQMKNTLCTSCFHSLRVVLDTKCCTAPALSCTRIPMRRVSLPGCRMLPIAFHGWKANSVAGEHTAKKTVRQDSSGIALSVPEGYRESTPVRDHPCPHGEGFGSWITSF